MLRCYITDRKALGGVRPLLEVIARNLALGLDYIQVREGDLPDRDLLDLLCRIQRLPNPRGTRVVVNHRTDLALASGSSGVHLTSNDVPASAVRRVLPPPFVIGVSCHSQEEVLAAERCGVDYAVFGPVYSTPSKVQYGEPVGLQRLAETCWATGLPVLALGGIDESRVAECLAAGAAGIAAIRMFQKP